MAAAAMAAMAAAASRFGGKGGMQWHDWQTLMSEFNESHEMQNQWVQLYPPPVLFDLGITVILKDREPAASKAQLLSFLEEHALLLVLGERELSLPLPNLLPSPSGITAFNTSTSAATGAGSGVAAGAGDGGNSGSSSASLSSLAFPSAHLLEAAMTARPTLQRLLSLLASLTHYHPPPSSSSSSAAAPAFPASASLSTHPNHPSSSPYASGTATASQSAAAQSAAAAGKLASVQSASAAQLAAAAGGGRGGGVSAVGGGGEAVSAAVMAALPAGLRQQLVSAITSVFIQLEAMDLFPDLLSSLVDLLLFAAKRTNHADRFIRQAACLGLRELEGAYPCVLQQYGGHVLAYLALERSFVWQGYVLLLSAIVKPSHSPKHLQAVLPSPSSPPSLTNEAPPLPAPHPAIQNLCTTFFAGSSQSLTKTSSGGSPFSSVSSISSLSSLASASAHAPQPSPSPSPSRLHPSSSTSSFSSLHHQSNHHHTQNSHHHQHYQQYQQQHHHQHHQQHQQQQQQHHHQQQHQHAHAPHLTSASSLPASAASFKIRPLTIGPPQADSLLALPFDPSAPPPFSLPLPWGLLLTRQQGEESEGRGGGAELGGVEIVPSQLPIAGENK
ncbi:unnamed protein product [Closterium sp. NIES-53]